MAHSKVVANWTPSVSANVAFVEAIWSLNGSEAPVVTLAADAVEAESPYSNPDGNTVGLKLTVVGTNGLRSAVAEASVVVGDHPPDEVAPEPVTGLVLNVVPVV